MKTRSSILSLIAFTLIVVTLYSFSGRDKELVDKTNFETAAINNLKNTNKNVNQTIQEKIQLFEFPTVDLFNLSDSRDGSSAREFVSTANFLDIDRSVLEEINNTKPENFTLEIPMNDGSIVLVDLTKNDILAEGFNIAEMTNGLLHDYTPGLYYKGVVRGKELFSLAAISVFSDHIMGIVSDEEGNWNLGPVRDENNNYTSEYIYYNDVDLTVKNEFKCGMEGIEQESTFPAKDFDKTLFQSGTGLDNPSSTVPLKVYFVADYSLYVAANGNLQTLADYITGFFNSVSTIYQNESIPFQIAYIAAYTNPDPMVNGPSTYEMRQIFGAQIQNNMQGGDIAHLLSIRNDVSGGLAYIRSLCQPYNPADSSGSYCVSVIEGNYEPYPNFSWTVTVVAHEMGHNVGSRHTHACVWPQPGGGIGPIDTCIINGENSTFSGFPEACIPIQPVSGCYSPANGTLMSYCHFCNTTFLGNGFGPLPGDTVRLRFMQAQNCLIGIENISSQIPNDFSLKQNYPNPFNPTTRIEFNIKQSGFVKLAVYDMLGKLVGTLVDGDLNPGTYQYTFEAESLPSGTYFYRLETVGFAETKRMILLK
ncbi:MAG TPA: M12 family metallo-peptidase [Ignavibacteria bacterium]|nr:M12 family metallo-peptidase [Ignavibacteria bacterium]